MRPGVKWQNLPPVNGREFEVEDVRWTYERYRSNESVLRAWLNLVDTIEVPDRNTVRINLKHPSPFLVSSLSSRNLIILAHELIEADGDAKRRMVGTSAFMMNEFVAKDHVSFKKNPDFWVKGRPYIDEYVYQTIPDEAQRTAAFRTGNTDFYWTLDPTIAETLKKAVQNINGVSLLPQWAVWGVYARNDKVPGNYIRFRRTLSMGFDRQSIIDNVYKGNAIVVGGMPWVMLFNDPPTHENFGPYFQYNPKQAKQLLKEACFENGFDFPTPLGFYRYNASHVSMVELAHRQLQEIGIRFNLQEQEYTTYVGRVYQGEYEDVNVGFIAPGGSDIFHFVSSFLKTGSSRNHSRVSDPEVDALIDKLASTFGAEEQRSIGRQIWDRELDQVWRAHLPMYSTQYMWQARVQNFWLGGGSDFEHWTNLGSLRMHWRWPKPARHPTY